MAEYKCIECGAPFANAEAQTKVKCVFCGTEQVIELNNEQASASEDMGEQKSHNIYDLFRGRDDVVSVNLPNGLTAIPPFMFEACTGLKSINIPNSVTSIGEYAFDGCISLVSVDIPDGITMIDTAAFNECASLASVSLPSGLTIIRNYAFDECTSLKEVIIPDGVTGIGDRAFHGLTSLVKITVPNSVNYIGENAFGDCFNVNYNIYDNAYYIGNDINPYLILVKAKDKAIESCVIHKDTKHIHSYAFAECNNLTKIIIPDDVVQIQAGAFAQCANLVEISLPDWAFYDGIAFGGCTKLRYTEYDNAYYIGNANNPYVLLYKAKDTAIGSCRIHPNTKCIEGFAFDGCSNLTNIVIPNGLLKICACAFQNCRNLTRVDIPQSVHFIENTAFFEGCENLRAINVSANNSRYMSKADGLYEKESGIRIHEIARTSQGEPSDIKKTDGIDKSPTTQTVSPESVLWLGVLTTVLSGFGVLGIILGIITRTKVNRYLEENQNITCSKVKTGSILSKIGLGLSAFSLLYGFMMFLGMVGGSIA